MPTTDHDEAPRSRFLLRALLVLGVASNLAFLLINLRPDRPHLVSRRHARILLRTEDARAKWIKENELDEFGAAHDIDLEVTTFGSFRAILEQLVAEKSKTSSDVLLAAVDDELVDDVRAAGAALAMDDASKDPAVMKDLGEFLPEAAAFAKDSGGKVWFWPKRAEMAVATFLTPAVEDVYLHWEVDRPAIQNALAEANGRGLPPGYRMEKTPGAWDSYDLFVAAWYWAHHPAPWAESTGGAPGVTGIRPRVALPTGANEDAVNDLFGTLFRHGMTTTDLGKSDVPPVIDALQWDALLRRHHLLAPECEGVKGIDSDGVRDLFLQGRLAWAPLDQEDAFWLHGGARRDADPGLPSPERLDWETMPVAASLEQASDGTPARKGRSYSFEEVQLWVVPVRSPFPDLAVELARFTTQRGIQQRETEALGLLPVRRDMQQNYPIFFRLSWMQGVLDASYDQIALGAGQIPEMVADQHYDDRYAAWRSALLARAPVTFADTRAAWMEVSRAK
jgi:hypothetical protein